MIGIIDYGMGNLFSVANTCAYLNLDAQISSDPAVLKKCDKLILPGVGAIKDCIQNLKDKGLYEFIQDEVLVQKKPILGICLGMQALYEFSEENGGVECFGFLKGNVIKMSDENIVIPHIGWNSLNIKKNHPLYERLSKNPYVYFDHSYFADGILEEELIGYCQYGKHKIPGLVGKENILGAQFHPEKSAQDGLKILEYFGRELA